MLQIIYQQLYCHMIDEWVKGHTNKLVAPYAMNLFP